MVSHTINSSNLEVSTLQNLLMYLLAEMEQTDVDTLFNYLVDCEELVAEEATKQHGLTPEEVDEGIHFKILAQPLAKLIKQGICSFPDVIDDYKNLKFLKFELEADSISDSISEKVGEISGGVIVEGISTGDNCISIATGIDKTQLKETLSKEEATNLAKNFYLEFINKTDTSQNRAYAILRLQNLISPEQFNDVWNNHIAHEHMGIDFFIQPEKFPCLISLEEKE